MSRFASVWEGEFNNILKEMNSVNTHRVTAVAWNIFLYYVKENKFSVDPLNISKQELNDILKLFDVEARKSDGGQYKRTNLNSLRFGLQRNGGLIGFLIQLDYSE